MSGTRKESRFGCYIALDIGHFVYRRRTIGYPQYAVDLRRVQPVALIRSEGQLYLTGLPGTLLSGTDVTTPCSPGGQCDCKVLRCLCRYQTEIVHNQSIGSAYCIRIFPRAVKSEHLLLRVRRNVMVPTVHSITAPVAA